LSAVLAAAAATPALGAEGDWWLGITGGLLGIGPELNWRPHNNVGARINGTFFSVSQTLDDGDISYEGKVKLNSWGVMVDYFPFGGSFHLPAGGRFNGNKISATARLPRQWKSAARLTPRRKSAR
jgi:hypothetical protein